MVLEAKFACAKTTVVNIIRDLLDFDDKIKESFRVFHVLPLVLAGWSNWAQILRYNDDDYWI